VREKIISPKRKKRIFIRKMEGKFPCVLNEGKFFVKESRIPKVIDPDDLSPIDNDLIERILTRKSIE
jgi:hypothetical protein